MRKDFVYLASASPRRSELLRQIGVPFKVRPAAINEDLQPGEAPAEYVLRLAALKAAVVWNALEDRDAAPVLAADTAVVLEDGVLGKPADAAQAERMLEALAGRTHRVLTAVALHDARGGAALLSASEVRMRPIAPAERRAYAQTGEPLDKAGGYGIQGFAAVFIESLTGSYSGVMGLPLFETAQLLARGGVPIWLTEGEAA